MSKRRPQPDVTYNVEIKDGVFEPLEPGPGVTVEIQAGVVMRATKGKLILCDKCEKYEWRCETVGQETWCTKVCVVWDCRELPAEVAGALTT